MTEVATGSGLFLSANESDAPLAAQRHNTSRAPSWPSHAEHDDQHPKTAFSTQIDFLYLQRKETQVISLCTLLQDDAFAPLLKENLFLCLLVHAIIVIVWQHALYLAVVPNKYHLNFIQTTSPGQLAVPRTDGLSRLYPPCTCQPKAQRDLSRRNLRVWASLPHRVPWSSGEGSRYPIVIKKRSL